jgi:NADPH:quinone reductase-like Zn-dependent oxidoreductase
MDMAGTVVALGPGTTGRIVKGDEVWADSGGVSGDSGGMAEYAVVNEAQTGKKPQSLNFTEAGTIPLVALTAIEMLQKTGAPWVKRTNVSVVVTSGTGGTGFMAVQLAKHAYNAATVVTAASGADNIAFAKSIGADVVVDYATTEVFDALPDDSIDIVIDNYGAKGTADKAMRAIRTGGVYLILPGGNGGTISNNPKKGVQQVNFGYTSSSDHANLDILSALFDEGKLVAHVFAAFSLENAASAFVMNKGGKVVGKVAVSPGV